MSKVFCIAMIAIDSVGSHLKEENVMKKIVVLMLVVGIAGCNVFTPSHTYEQAQGKVTIDDKEYPMIIGDFEWVEENFEARKLNPTNINDLAEQFETVEVAQGQKLTIKIEQDPSSLIIDQWNGAGEMKAVEITDNEISVPTETGEYIYEVTAGWSEGKISYVFDIKIK